LLGENSGPGRKSRASGPKQCANHKKNRRSLHYAPPDFLFNLIALAILMRLSLRKGAYVDAASSAW
jgi:hypothetical protein